MSGMTIICLHMSSGPPPLDAKRHKMTIICLCVPSDMIVSEWRKVSGMTIICLRMSHDLRVSMTEIVGQSTKARLLLLHILNKELRPT